MIPGTQYGTHIYMPYQVIETRYGPLLWKGRSPTPKEMGDLVAIHAHDESPTANLCHLMWSQLGDTPRCIAVYAGAGGEWVHLYGDRSRISVTPINPPTGTA